MLELGDFLAEAATQLRGRNLRHWNVLSARRQLERAAVPVKAASRRGYPGRVSPLAHTDEDPTAIASSLRAARRVMRGRDSDQRGFGFLLPADEGRFLLALARVLGEFDELLDRRGCQLDRIAVAFDDANFTAACITESPEACTCAHAAEDHDGVGCDLCPCRHTTGYTTRYTRETVEKAVRTWPTGAVWRSAA